MVAKKVEEIVSERMNELNNGIMQEAVVEKNKVEKIITEPILQKEFKKKYADFCFNGNNEAIIEIRDLGENSKFGMFTIIFDDSSVAKYTMVDKFFTENTPFNYFEYFSTFSALNQYATKKMSEYYPLENKFST
jgi:hypothetical protein